jgi:uncharacterized protein (TIGR02996 family)
MAKSRSSTYPVNPALEAAVVADAEDDAPRLVYADWLEDHGDPVRAEYIRNECALWDKLPADADYPARIERRLELRVQVQPRTMEPKLPTAVGFHDSSLEGGDDSSVAFHRGFPYFAQDPHVEGGHPGRTHAEAFRDALAGVVSETTIRGVDFYTLWRHFDVISSSPAAGRLSAISCHNSDPEDGPTAAEMIAASPAAANLVWLDLAQMSTNRDLTALASAEFPRLLRLETNWWMPEDRVSDLLQADWFGRLRRIRMMNLTGSGDVVGAGLGRLPQLHTIESYEVHSDALGALAAPGAFPALGRLSICASLRGAGSVTLANAELPLLAVLELEGCGLRNDDVRTLLGASWFGRLRVLGMPTNEIGDRGVAAIAASPAAKNLQVLSLGDNSFGKGGLTAIARPGAFPSLTTLDLHSSVKRKASEDDVTRFLGGLEIPGLRHLDLNGWPVNDAGARAIVNNPSLANLAWLSLGYCRIGKAGLEALAESPHLRKLIYLYLSSNPCEQSADVLLDPTSFPNLAECWITRFSDPLGERLQKARPGVWWL